MRKHTAAISWPNGLGETPCTDEYAKQHALVEDLRLELYGADWPHSCIPESEQSPEAYEAYHRAQAQLDQLLVDGHVGKSIRY